MCIDQSCVNISHEHSFIDVKIISAVGSRLPEIFKILFVTPAHRDRLSLAIGHCYAMLLCSVLFHSHSWHLVDSDSCAL